MKKKALSQIADDWIIYWRLASDPATNTRPFRKSVETGKDPLPCVLGQGENYLKQPEMAWEFILELVERADSDMLLCLIGAGPLETLLSRYPEPFIKKSEDQARKDARFKICLSHVWGTISFFY